MKNNSSQQYLENLTPNDNTDYSLWKATKWLKRPQQQITPLFKPDGSWAWSNTEKSQTFVKHLFMVIQPVASKNVSFDEEVLKYLHSPYKMVAPKPYKTNEVKEII